MVENAKIATVVCERRLMLSPQENSADLILAREMVFGEELFVEPASS
jgi:hypothetical protein